ncbi:Copper-exporting P-type ATPase [Sporomusa carbonis]|uniref:heavy-metal-associated domain-containing protein n=1 Tax=Sporomusa carbonis TaxID=3076075 RepID=UPI003A5D5D74
MSKLVVKVAGMSCASCAARIEKSLAALDGVQAANVNFAMERLTVEFDPRATNADAIVKKVKDTGYEVVTQKQEFNLREMSCAACATRIERAVAKLPGRRQDGRHDRRRY